VVPAIRQWLPQYYTRNRTMSQGQYYTRNRTNPGVQQLPYYGASDSAVSQLSGRCFLWGNFNRGLCRDGTPVSCLEVPHRV